MIEDMPKTRRSSILEEYQERKNAARVSLESKTPRSEILQPEPRVAEDGITDLNTGLSLKRPVRLIGKRVKPGPHLFKPGQSGNPATQFQPGTVGNPAGVIRRDARPISNAVRAFLAEPYTGKCKRWRDRQYTNAQALAAKQLELAIEEGDMRAAEELANRAEGKTVNITQLQGAEGGPIEIAALTPEEKAARIRELMEKAGNEL